MTQADWHRIAAAEDVHFSDAGRPIAVLEDGKWLALSFE